MLKPNIAFDVDGVLCELQGPLVADLNSQLGLDVPIRDLSDYWLAPHFAAAWNALHPDGTSNGDGGPLTADDVQAIIEQIIYQPGYFGNLPVYVGNIRAFALLNGLAEHMHIVTARKLDHPTFGKLPHVAEETAGWLVHHGFAFSQLAFTHEKARYCREHQVHYIFEDSPAMAESCYAAGVGVFLMDKPWNQHVPTRPGLWRITVVREALTILEPIIKERFG